MLPIFIRVVAVILRGGLLPYPIATKIAVTENARESSFDS